MISGFFEKSWKRALGVSLLLTILALIYTFPLIMNFSKVIPGKGGDLSVYYWCHTWFSKALSQWSNPWHTDMLWYPNGTTLVFNTSRFGSAFMAWFLTPVVGSIASYNLIILLSFVVSGLGIYLLVREWSGSEIGAIAAAIVFVFNPFKFNKLIYHHFLLSTYTFGFALWILLKILKGNQKRIRNGIILGLLVGITAYESIFYLDFLALALLLVIIWYAAFERAVFWRHSTLLPLLIAALTAAIALAPMAAIVITDFHEYGRLPAAGGSEGYSNDLLALFAPSPTLFSGIEDPPELIFSKRNFIYNTPEENAGIVGWPVLVLAILGWWWNRKGNPIARFSALGVLVFAVLSLGPFLQVGGSNRFFVVETIGPIAIPMPYVFLQFFPPIGMVRTPSRFIILGFIFLAILVGLAIAGISKRMRGKWAVIPVLLVILIVLDYFPRGIAIINPVAAPEPVERLAGEEGDFGVLHYGINSIDNMRFGTVHGKPHTTGYISRTTRYSRPLQDFSAASIRYLQRFARQHPTSPRLQGISANARKLFNAWGIGAVLYKGDEVNVPLLASLLNGRVVSSEDDLSLILLPHPQPPEITNFTIDADSWPRMPGAGLEIGANATQMTIGMDGFLLCVPDDLMPKGEITLSAWSAIRSVPARRLTLNLYVNRTAVGSWKLNNEESVLRVTLPEQVRRLPVNIIAIRPLLPRISKRDPLYPFETSVISGNVGAGNATGLTFKGNVIMPARNRGATINIAILADEPAQLDRIISLTAADRNSGEIAAEKLRNLGANEWALIFTSGKIGTENTEAIRSSIKRFELANKPENMNGKAFIVLVSGSTETGIVYSSKRGAIHLIVNGQSVLDGPVINLNYIDFQ